MAGGLGERLSVPGVVVVVSTSFGRQLVGPALGCSSAALCGSELGCRGGTHALSGEFGRDSGHLA